MSGEQKIKVKAMCLLTLGGRVLVADGNSMRSSVRPVEASKFYRVLGGSINFGEDAENAVRREVREEIRTEIEDLERIDVIENRFTYAGEEGHEVVFLFKGTPQQKEWDFTKPIHIIEDTYEFDAVWVPVVELMKGDTPLFPAFNYARYLS